MDKLVAPVTVKFSSEDAEDLKALAESRGMEVSEYIRHLVLADRQAAHKEWESLNRIFGQKDGADKENLGKRGRT